MQCQWAAQRGLNAKASELFTQAGVQISNFDIND